MINGSRKKEVEIRFSNLGTLYLASYLRAYGGHRDIHVIECGNLSERTLREINPDIVGISSITQHFNIAKKLSATVKEVLDIPVVVGGYHISMLPNNLTDDMDIGVCGEGEETMLELVSRYEEDGLDKNHLGNIRGIVFKPSSSKLELTAKRELITPLDKIPIPARDLLNFNESTNIYTLTSRGCPYRCVFCSSSAFWKSVRYFSPEYVVEEIREIVNNYHPKAIDFCDDLFAVNKKRLREIASLIKKEEFYGNVKFTCQARANLVDDEIATLLKKIGVTQVSMGLESGSERMLKYLKMDSVTVEDNNYAINVLKSSGLKVNATFIIGSPTETREEILQTLDFIKHSKLDSFEAYVMLPLPNTPVWDDAKKKGVVNDYMNWDEFEIDFQDDPGKRVAVSDLNRDELLGLLESFKDERKKRLAKRLLLQGIFHPRKAFKFVKKKVGVWRRLRKNNGDSELIAVGYCEKPEEPIC